MTVPYRKKLIEVALPLEAISEESSQRKRKAPSGYPTTFHKWWAQRPLAACRAVLFASLVDDPDSDPSYAHYDADTREQMAGEKRQQLFDLIEELVKWENSTDGLVINAARAEIARCLASRKIESGEVKKDQKLSGGDIVYDLVIRGHGDLAKLREGKVRLPNPESVNSFLIKYAPPVLDPFAGGGSIPLEAQRLGLRVFASDLNPVPVLINKALIEIPPRFSARPPVNPESRGEAGPAGKRGRGGGKSVFGHNDWCRAQGLAADVRYFGRRMCEEARRRLGHIYPNVVVTSETVADRPDLAPMLGEELQVVAWLWARTVASPDPSTGGKHVPLVGSFWLCSKQGKRSWVQPEIDKKRGEITFRVRVGDPPTSVDPRKGTVTRTGATCSLSGTPIPFDYIRAEGKAGRIGRQLMAIVADTARGRVYLDPSKAHSQVAEVPSPTWTPDTPLPTQALSFRVQLYGMDRHDKLFTGRQLTALQVLCELLPEVQRQVLQRAAEVGLPDDGRGLEAGGEGGTAYAEAIAVYLAAAISRIADYNSALATWRPKDNAMRSTFSKQALPMVWDFAEANVFASSSAGITDCVDVVARALEFVPGEGIATVRQLDAAAAAELAGHPVTSTDPPYYSNIGYADLSDYLYVWLRRGLSHIYPSLFSTMLTPKTQELIASPYRHAGGMDDAKAFFESGLRAAFSSIKASSTPDFPTTVFYAFKQAESDDEGDANNQVEATASTGWETMLSAFNSAGFVIKGTWPMRTEGDNRSVGIGANALASSVVLVGVPRAADAPLATRREFLTALKLELPSALQQLQRGSIAPVDLAQAAIGPGMSVFTRYAKVIEADGTSMTVRQALALINHTLDEVLAEQEGEFDADTRWALAWFAQVGMEEGTFGVAEMLSRAKNTAVNALEQAGLVRARSGKVRLLKRGEMPADWNPATDTRVRHWEVAQHLIRALETGGETAAASLLRRVGGMGEVARDLAYRLFNICERKGWASEALAYNGLVIAWPEISKLAQSGAPAATTTQGEMF